MEMPQLKENEIKSKLLKKVNFHNYKNRGPHMLTPEQEILKTHAFENIAQFKYTVKTA